MFTNEHMIKGQASTEYLVLFAVLLVVVLTVVFLLRDSLYSAPEQKENIGKAAWAGAFPISVDEIVWRGSSMSFYVKNNDFQTITIRFMRFSPYAAGLMNVQLVPQQRRQISFGVWPSCPGQGLSYSFNDFYFLYDAGLLTNITQKVNVPYSGKCL